MRLRLTAIAAGVLFVTAACGTRVNHNDVVTASRSLERDGVRAGAEAAIASPLEASTESAQPTGAALEPGDTRDAAVPAGATRRQARDQSQQPADAAAGPTTAAAGTPVKVASVGTISGPGGAVLAPQLNGLKAWMKTVNDRGGINGHRVNVLTVDDGGDPARHRAAVQRAVETDGVLAFVHNLEALAGGSSVTYLTGKRVPVIGSETGSPWFYTSPTYFPQATSGRYLNDAAIIGIAPEALSRGKRKWGVFACLEAQNCRQVFQDGADVATSAGLTPVYRAQVSLAQPDFTAECLAARNAGVEILFLGLDQNSIGRVGQSCARAGFRPIYNLAAPLVFARQAKDPNLAGTLATSVVFPWFQGDTPATAEFQTAAKKYLGGQIVGVSETLGWTSGKLFERAMKSLSGPPTREGLLRALWTVKDDTLDGLTMPLTFSPNQPAKPRLCWFTLGIRDGRWVSNSGFKRACK